MRDQTEPASNDVSNVFATSVYSLSASLPLKQL